MNYYLRDNSHIFHETSISLIIYETQDQIMKNKIQQRSFAYYGVALFSTILLVTGCKNKSNRDVCNVPLDDSLTISATTTEQIHLNGSSNKLLRN